MLIENTSASPKADDREAPKAAFNVMVIAAETCPEISTKMVAGALEALEKSGAKHKLYKVPRISEIPIALRYAIRSMELFPARPRYEAYLVLGCHVATNPGNHISVAVSHAMQDIAVAYTVAIGNGIITLSDLDDDVQSPTEKGAESVHVCLEMAELKRVFGLFPRKF